MYHASAQSVDERMINVHYYYYYYMSTKRFLSALESTDRKVEHTVPVVPPFGRVSVLFSASP